MFKLLEKRSEQKQRCLYYLEQAKAAAALSNSFYADFDFLHRLDPSLETEKALEDLDMLEHFSRVLGERAEEALNDCQRFRVREAESLLLDASYIFTQVHRSSQVVRSLVADRHGLGHNLPRVLGS